MKLNSRAVFSVSSEVDAGSWEVDVAEERCQQHFAETGNLTVNVGIAIR